MRIQQIRNATVKIEMGGMTFLTDPWLQDQGCGFSAPSVRPEMEGVKSPLVGLPESPESILRGVDALLVTHVHPDHVTMDYLPLDLPVIAQSEEDAKKLRQMGFLHVSFFAEDTLAFGPVRMTRTEAIHGDNPEVAEMMGKASGFVLEAEGEKTLCLAGDTVYFDGVRETIERFHPGVIILNCCGATIPNGRLIMNEKEVGLVCKDAPDAVVIASHLDTVNHATISRADVRSYVQAQGFSNVLVPEDGEEMRFS